jgi:hypothetical protein
MYASLWRVLVEDLEHFLDLGELRLGLGNDLLQFLAGLLLGDVLGAGIVLERAVVLDLLARVLDFGEAQRGRGAFEEVAELAECLEVVALLLLSVCGVSAACRRVHMRMRMRSAARPAARQGLHRSTHRFESILSNVLSAWPKKSKTMLLLNSRSTSSSSISRICSKVAGSIVSSAPGIAMMPSAPFCRGKISCGPGGARERDAGGWMQDPAEEMLHVCREICDQPRR